MESISIAVAAYNEGEIVLHTVKEILKALDGMTLDAEILVIDDSSTDGTGAFCRQAETLSPIVKSYRNETNLGFGGVYQRGASLASKEWYVIFPGDNAFDWHGIRRMFDALGGADIIAPYTVNMDVRNAGRRILSKAFTWIMNQISGRKIHYYNGPVIHRTQSIRALKNVSFNFAFQAEIMCEFLSRGASVREVGVRLQEIPGRKSSALKFRNVVGVGHTLLRLMLRGFLKRQSRAGL